MASRPHISAVGPIASGKDAQYLGQGIHGPRSGGDLIEKRTTDTCRAFSRTF